MSVIKNFTTMNIENTPECFVQLWRQLERTRRLLGGQYKRYSVRNVLRVWFGYEATDDFVWEVCRMATLGLNNGNDDEPIYGNDILPLPSLYPRKHRELLRAIVAVKLGLSIRKVSFHALDAAYSIAFPNSTSINVNKKKKSNE